MTEDKVNHPHHYEWLKELAGVEPIDICRHFGFAVGNALKYILRKGKKDGDMTDREKRIEDLRKAIFYLNDEINRLTQQDNGKIKSENPTPRDGGDDNGRGQDSR